MKERGLKPAFKVSVLGACRENRNFGRETAIIHLQHRLHSVSDIFAAEFRRIRLLLVAGGRSEVGKDFAGVDEENADIVLAEFASPAFSHATKRELACIVGGA